MPQSINLATWHPKAQELKTLMLGINERNGSVNCGRVALRLDEHLRASRHLGLPPVATQSAGMYNLTPI
ncbi:MAG: hypothetical protein JWM09_282 [Francisellaceae bacterium]|nr:hypothetical protein [Francisellaceae bacterium]